MKFLFTLLICSTCFSHVLEENLLTENLKKIACHSSTIVEIDKESLIACWQGVDEKDKQIIYLSYFKNGKWDDPQEFIRGETKCWDPVLVKDKEGKIFLFYKEGTTPRSWKGMVTSSLDGGITWSKREILPAGIIGPSHSKPIFTLEGEMICGSSWESGSFKEQNKATACWIEITADEGKTWQKIGPIEKPGSRFGLLQPSLFFDGKGNIVFLARDRAKKLGEKGYLWTGYSEDGGRTFKGIKATSIPNPDAAVDVLRLEDGRILLVYNPSHNKRAPLQIDISEDGGENWKHFLTVESEEGEYSYPSLIQTKDGNIHLTYTYSPQGSKKIKHLIFTLE